jgi:hypothetical protein
VIGQAVSDAGEKRISQTTRAQARTFLDGGPALEFWCAVAGLPCDVVVSHARAKLSDRPQQVLNGSIETRPPIYLPFRPRRTARLRPATPGAELPVRPAGELPAAS